jgi:selenide,water dikinase
MEHPDLIEGHTRFSDAGVFRLRPDLAIVQTVDFFPPVVDDPRDYGRIAAANSLSDCYAMGGKPVTALQVAGFPSGKLDVSVLGEIFAGGAEKVLESGAVVVGGHTVTDSEVKYGLVVTGTIHPERVVSNSGARPGDRLVLTKSIGMGSVSTAIKNGKASDDAIARAVQQMATLNRDACDAMLELGAKGATDITGFGILGHGFELAEASRVTLRIAARRVPVFSDAEELARRGIVSGGAARNRQFLGERVRWLAKVDRALEALLYDSETSGGLLITIAADRAAELVARLRGKGHAAVADVGEVVRRGAAPIEVTGE